MVFLNFPRQAMPGEPQVHSRQGHCKSAGTLPCLIPDGPPDVFAPGIKIIAMWRDPIASWPISAKGLAISAVSRRKVEVSTVEAWG